MTKRRKPYRKPDGTIVKTERAYVVAWRAFAEPLCKLFKAELRDYDPGVVLRMRDGRRVQFDTFVVERLNAGLAAAMLVMKELNEALDAEAV